MVLGPSWSGRVGGVSAQRNKGIPLSAKGQKESIGMHESLALPSLTQHSEAHCCQVHPLQEAFEESLEQQPITVAFPLNLLEGETTLHAN